MSPELIAILAAGAALLGTMLAQLRSVRQEIGSLRAEMTEGFRRNEEQHIEIRAGIAGVDKRLAVVQSAVTESETAKQVRDQVRDMLAPRSVSGEPRTAS